MMSGHEVKGMKAKVKISAWKSSVSKEKKSAEQSTGNSGNASNTVKITKNANILVNSQTLRPVPTGGNGRGNSGKKLPISSEIEVACKTRNGNSNLNNNIIWPSLLSSSTVSKKGTVGVNNEKQNVPYVLKRPATMDSSALPTFKASPIMAWGKADPQRKNKNNVNSLPAAPSALLNSKHPLASKSPTECKAQPENKPLANSSHAPKAANKLSQKSASWVSVPKPKKEPAKNSAATAVAKPKKQITTAAKTKKNAAANKVKRGSLVSSIPITMKRPKSEPNSASVTVAGKGNLLSLASKGKARNNDVNKISKINVNRDNAVRMNMLMMGTPVLRSNMQHKDDCAPPLFNSKTTTTTNESFFASSSTSISKGRQRVKPRKKRLTTLKKKVLQERLCQWNEQQQAKQPQMDKHLLPSTESKDDTVSVENLMNVSSSSVTNEVTTIPSTEKEHSVNDSAQICSRENFDGPVTILVRNLLTNEDVDDEECFEECRHDIRSLLQQFGTIMELSIEGGEGEHPIGTVLVTYDSKNGGNRAIDKLQDMVLGGNIVSAEVLSLPVTTDASKAKASSQEHCQQQEEAEENTTIVLENALTEEDMEDDECLEECLSDINKLLKSFGTTNGFRVERRLDSGERGTVFVSYTDKDNAERAVNELNGFILGGSVVVAKIIAPKKNIENDLMMVEKTTVVIENMLTEDDLEDDESFEECKCDIHRLVQVGPIFDFKIERRKESPERGLVFVSYTETETAKLALAKLNGMVVGGNVVSAKIKQPDDIYFSEMTASDDADKVTISLENVLTEEDMEDDECWEESKVDIRTLLQQFGSIQDLKMIREGAERGAVYVVYASSVDVRSTVSKLNGMVIGGNSVVAKPMQSNSKLNNSLISLPPSQSSLKKEMNVGAIIVSNILNEDDYSDDDCLEETKEDILSLLEPFGTVQNIELNRTGPKKGLVCVTFTGGPAVAAKASVELDGLMIGGSKVEAKVDDGVNSVSPSCFSRTQCERDVGHSQSSKSEAATATVILENVLTEEDFTDDDCFEETKNDIYSLANCYGTISLLNVKRDGPERGLIYISYNDDLDIAKEAVKGINGRCIGGNIVSATLSSQSKEAITHAREATSPESTDAKRVNSSSSTAASDAPSPPPPSHTPMYSGDKIIPQKYVACKVVPKVQFSVLRDYASRVPDESALTLLTEMLSELMRFQLRSKDDANARARRRLVIGLREVARGIRAHKIKMVIMANNLDQYGAIDAKLEEILMLCQEEDVPVLFELSKRKLGKALGKSVKVSVVGVQNADGAHEQFKKLNKLSRLTRIPSTKEIDCR